MTAIENSHKVTLFFVGPPRSGSTFLYDVFRKNPEVFVPSVKEPHFFCTDLHDEIAARRDKAEDRSIQGAIHSQLVTDRPAYDELFARAAGYRHIAEFTPMYLSSRDAWRNIYDYNPSARIIAVLRDPVERAISQYRMDIGSGDVSGSFAESVATNPTAYVDPGLYFRHVNRFLSVFPSEQITLLRFEDLDTRTVPTLHELCLTLGVPEPSRADIDTARKNSANRRPRLPGLNRWLKSQTALLSAANRVSSELVTVFSAFLHRPLNFPGVGRESKADIQQLFEADVENLEKLTGWDLRTWKN